MTPRRFKVKHAALTVYGTLHTGGLVYLTIYHAGVKVFQGEVYRPNAQQYSDQYTNLRASNSYRTASERSAYAPLASERPIASETKASVCVHRERKHCARGLCSRCYFQWLYRHSPTRAAQARARVKRWRARNKGMEV